MNDDKSLAPPRRRRVAEVVSRFLGSDANHGLLVVHVASRDVARAILARNDCRNAALRRALNAFVRRPGCYEYLVVDANPRAATGPAAIYHAATDADAQEAMDRACADLGKTRPGVWCRCVCSGPQDVIDDLITRFATRSTGGRA